MYAAVVIAGFIVAQTTKLLLQTLGNRRLPSSYDLVASGNMPSTHTTMAVAVATVAYFEDGLLGATFGLALLVTVIIAYDAMNTRRSVGELGQLLALMAEHEKRGNLSVPRAVLGHRPNEVLVGALLGFTVGLTAFLVFS